MGFQDGDASATVPAYPAVPVPGPYPHQEQAQPLPNPYPPVYVQPAAPPLTTTAASVTGKPTITTIVITDPQQPHNPCCTCSPGWWLFGFGWMFMPLWIIGVFLPLCTKKRSDGWAALASGIALLVCAAVIGLVMGLVVVPIIYALASDEPY